MNQQMNQQVKKIFDSFGNIYGPILLLLIAFLLLEKKQNLFFYYFVGVFLNVIINIILKGIFKQPRPSDDLKTVELALKKGLFLPFDVYGMPSGHAQFCAFSSVFLFLSTKNWNILFLLLFLSLIVVWQRIYFEYHSISQILVGLIVGGLFGFIIYSFSQNKIKGVIREKKDDSYFPK